MRRLTLALLILPWVAVPVSGEPDWQAEAARAEAELASATSQRARIRALTDLIAAQERGQAELRAALRHLRATEAEVAARAAEEVARLPRYLSAAALLDRLKDADAPLPLLHPGGGVDAVRAQILAGALARRDGDLRRAVVEDLDAVRAAHAQVTASAVALDRLHADTAAARRAMIEDAGPLPDRSERRETLAAIARTLGDRTDTAFPPAPLPLPVAAAKPEVASDGWILRAGPGALVRAPSAASIRFAGRLRGHRGTVVMELAPGRILTLAGLGHLLVAEGADVVTGDAIGFLPDVLPHTNVTTAPFPGGPLPSDALYMETRDDNRPVDPADWFAVEKDS